MKILVTPKTNPDLDGCACAVAYADLLRKEGRDAEAVIFGSPQSEVRYFIERYGISIPAVPENAVGDWKQFVLVDASSMKGMPQPVAPDAVIEVIDHRPGGEPEKEFPNARIQNDFIGAAATLVTERLMRARVEPSRDVAMLLYGAIYHNSLNFAATNTHERDHVAASWLAERYSFGEDLIQKMFEFATAIIADDVKRALYEDSKEFGSGYTIGSYQLIVWGDEIMEQKESMEEVVRDLAHSRNEQWAVLLVTDVKNKKTSLYATTNEACDIVARALGRPQFNRWLMSDVIILRKQLMPLIMKTLT